MAVPDDLFMYIVAASSLIVGIVWLEVPSKVITSPELENVPVFVKFPPMFKLSSPVPISNVAADIVKLRDARKDPYKQKGVRYKGAILRKKVGKKVK